MHRGGGAVAREVGQSAVKGHASLSALEGRVGEVVGLDGQDLLHVRVKVGLHVRVEVHLVDEAVVRAVVEALVTKGVSKCGEVTGEIILGFSSEFL